MSSFEDDSKYNSSNDDDGEIVRASNSSHLPPGLINQPTILSQVSVTGVGGVQMGDGGGVGIITDKYGKSRGEMDFKDSQDQDVMEELGLNLGRRLARLELGNKINTEKLENVKERCKIKEKTRAMDNSRVDDLKGKMISMEARLASEEKRGFDAKERIERLEKTLKMKDKEMSELKEILSKMDAKCGKEEERFSKLEEGSDQLTKQFLVLLETCETFNDELQALKKMNIDLKRELNKKEMAKDSFSGEISSSALISNSRGQESKNAIKPEGLFCYSDHQKVQPSQNVSAELEKKWRGKAENRVGNKWSQGEIKELRKDKVCMHCISHKCFVQNYLMFAKTKTWKCQKRHPKKEVNDLQLHNSAAQPRSYYAQECSCKSQPSGYYAQESSNSQSRGYYAQDSSSKSQPSGHHTQESSNNSQSSGYYAQESSSKSQPGGYYVHEYAQESSPKSHPISYYTQESSSKSQPSGYYAQESSSKSSSISYCAQEFVPKNPLDYCYSGPAGTEPYYYTTATQPTFMVYGDGAGFSGFQNHEYGPH